MLKKDDVRLRKIPLPTKKPTFKELQRIKELLLSVEVYGKLCGGVFSFSLRYKALFYNAGDLDEFLSFENPPKSPPRPLNPLGTPRKTKPAQGKKKGKKIDRNKSRQEVQRPLPQVIQTSHFSRFSFRIKIEESICLYRFITS